MLKNGRASIAKRSRLEKWRVASSRQITRLALAVAVLSTGLISPDGNAAECSACSPEHPVALLELYSSEGCSSCPPADAWIATLSGQDMVVPLVFHVDYWNDLGWRDRFSQHTFGLRQKARNGAAAQSWVYTPQFLLNGKDYRRWSTADLSTQLEKLRAQRAEAAIDLQVRGRGEDVTVTAKARIANHVKTSSAKLYVAVYENAVTSQIDTGENRGRTLHHHFVVRLLSAPVEVHGGEEAALLLPVHLGADWKAGGLGIAAFVEDSENGNILQATALPMCS